MDTRYKKLASCCRGFDWGEGNAEKIWLTNKVRPTECEQLFLNRPLVIWGDITHSHLVQRSYALGVTDLQRTLFLAFRLRNLQVRVIAAREMRKSKKRSTQMRKNLPEFETEEQESAFWAGHDSTEYLDWRQADQVTFATLKPSLKKISLRLPEPMLEELKLLANKKDVPYQSLLKVFLAERIQQELGS